MTLRATLLSALLLSAIGCGPDYGDAYVKSFFAARRAYSAGRYAEAERLYAQAAVDAQRIKDRDEALFMQARTNEKLGRHPQAKAAYESIVAATPRGPRAGRAAFQVARLEIEHGDAEAGYEALGVAIRRWPSNPAAHRALMQWVEHAEQTQGPEATERQLRIWQVQLMATTLAQQVLYEQARLRWRVGDLSTAHERFLETARRYPYPQGNLSDDALWHASHVAEEMGDYRLAVTDLEELLATREVSALGGSYERPRYPEAQLRVGLLQRDRLGDPAAAREAFRRTYERHGKSRVADDAMWNEAVLAWRGGEAEASCDLAEELRERFPDSRYRRCLTRICPAEPTPEGRACPDYILRTLDGSPPGEGEDDEPTEG